MAPRRGDSQAHLEARALGVGGELRELPYPPHGTEEVHTLSSGTLDGKQGLVCLTQERLIFVEKGFGHTSMSMVDFPVKAIIGVSTKRGMTGESLEITTPAPPLK